MKPVPVLRHIIVLVLLATLTRVACADEMLFGDAPRPLPPTDPAAWRYSAPTDEFPGFLVTDSGETFRLVPETSENILASMNAPAASGSAPVGGGEAQEDNGTNPAKNARTLIFANEFYDLKGGNEINTSYARIKAPLYGGRGSYLLEVPFLYYDLESPVAGQVGGIGDVKFQFSLNAWVSQNKRLTFLTFLELYIPSADNLLLTNIPDQNEFFALNVGTGKYVLGPGVGVVYAIDKSTIFAPLYFYEQSVAGDENRPEVSRGKWRIFLMRSWQSGIYTLPELNMITNYLDGATDAYIAPEVGYAHKGTTFYCKPGLGIDPQENERDWGVEFGARVMF